VKPRIADIEELLETPSGGWRIPEMTSTHSALPALLRLARATHALIIAESHQMAAAVMHALSAGDGVLRPYDNETLTEAVRAARVEVAAAHDAFDWEEQP